MKIVSYNLKFGGKGRVHWREILDRFSPVAMLVQESYPPSEHLPNERVENGGSSVAWGPAYGSNGNRKWGSGIYLADCQSTPIQLPEFHGWVVGAEVKRWSHSPNRSLKTRFFSLHAPSGMGSYQKIVNEILDCLLDFRDGCELIIAGDFNLTVSERHAREKKTTSNPDRKIQARLRDEFGLLNCWQSANPNKFLPQTLRWVSNPDVPYHCDGIFVPEEWADSLNSCDVIAGTHWNGLSDHNPILATFV